MKSVTQMEAIHQQLLSGERILNWDTAAELKKLQGHRFDKKEKAVDLAIETDRAAGKIAYDDRGEDALFDLLKQDTQSRFSAFVQGARDGAALGAKVGGAIGGAVGATAGIASGLAAGPAAALTAGAAGALATALPPAVVGALVVGGAEGAWYAIRN